MRHLISRLDKLEKFMNPRKGGGLIVILPARGDSPCYFEKMGDKERELCPEYQRGIKRRSGIVLIECDNCGLASPPCSKGAPSETENRTS